MLVLGAILIVIWVAILALRVPSFVAFFSLLVGQLLATEASSDVYEFVSSLLQIPEFRYVQIGLLFLPLLLTVLFLKGRVAKSKLYIEFIPALFVAATALMLFYPLAPELQKVLDSQTQDKTEYYKTIIIGAASVSGLLSAWLTYPKHHSDKKHGKKHK
jgi:hypothetical protein